MDYVKQNRNALYLRKNKVLGFTVLIALLSSACSSDIPFIIPVTTEPKSGIAPTIVFSGKVTEPTTGEWKNDYIVLVFLDGEEIDRQASYLGKLEQSGEGVHDGLFKIGVINTYELSPDNIFSNTANEQIPFANVSGNFGRIDYMYTWFGEVNPGQLIRVDVPEKQIQYAIKIMPTTSFDATTILPPPHQAILTDDGNIVPKTTLSEATPETVQPEGVQTPVGEQTRVAATPYIPPTRLP